MIYLLDCKEKPWYHKNIFVDLGGDIMGGFDWNGNGKEDLTDRYIDYEVYQEVTDGESDFASKKQSIEASTNIRVKKEETAEEKKKREEAAQERRGRYWVMVGYVIVTSIFLLRFEKADVNPFLGLIVVIADGIGLYKVIEWCSEPIE